MDIRNGILYSCTNTSGELIIPEYVEEIRYAAFSKCNELTNVVFQEGLIKIDEWAFNHCSNLVSITLPASVETIEMNAFENCPNLKEIKISPDNKRFQFKDGMLIGQNGKRLRFCVNGIEGSCKIPEGVRQISPSAFANCSKITEIIMPDSVREIGTDAFAQCNALKKLQISPNVNKFGVGICRQCSNLQEIILPDGITSIGTDAFNSCTSLSYVKLPQELEKIGEYAFKKCTSLREIKLPSKLTIIKKHAFEESKLEQLEIPESVTEIEVNAFASTLISELEIPATLKTVGLYNFRECPLSKVTLLGDSTKLIAGSLGEGDFDLYADKIPLINIHQVYKNNAIQAFAKRFIANEEIPDVRRQEYLDYIKRQRKRLYSFALEKNAVLQLMISQKFIPQEDIKQLIEEASSKKYTESGAMLLEYQHQAFKHIDQEAIIERELKRQMRLLETGEFPVGEAKKIWRFETKEDETIRIIGYKGKETRVQVPEKIGKRIVSEIGKYAFSPVEPRQNSTVKKDRQKIESIIIPEGIKDIGECAFAHCTSLTNLVIPSSVTSIGNEATLGCCDLCGLVISPDNCNYTTDGISLYTKDLKVLISSPSSAGDYIISETVEKIEANAFANNNKITSITIPKNVKVIENNTFQECSNLGKVHFQSGLKRVCERAFFRCSSLKSIEFPDGFEHIERCAFEECYNLADIKIPKSTNCINALAFPPNRYPVYSLHRVIYAPAKSVAANYAVKWKYDLVTEK